MKSKKRGERSVCFTQAPRVISAANIVGPMEGKGPLGCAFDTVLEDDMMGEASFEKAEKKIFEKTVRLALDKVNYDIKKLQCLLGGDLLNQIITANFAARELHTPFLGLYGACSTMAESLLIGGMLIDGGYMDTAACIASSHFSTAERQFRMPLEMGATSPPTAQRTVTGAGAVLLSSIEYKDNNLKNCMENIKLTGGTIGRVVDMGITDANNMGAAMAPAAADTILSYIRDNEKDITAYDAIVTGDLGLFGSEMLLELCMDEGLDIEDRHIDCGNIIFDESQDVNCGGSGCGCSAVVLTAHLLPLLVSGAWQNMLFVATGALMSPASSQQGESIPGIAHAIMLERISI